MSLQNSYAELNAQGDDGLRRQDLWEVINDLIKVAGKSSLVPPSLEVTGRDGNLGGRL